MQKVKVIVVWSQDPPLQRVKFWAIVLPSWEQVHTTCYTNHLKANHLVIEWHGTFENWKRSGILRCFDGACLRKECTRQVANKLPLGTWRIGSIPIRFPYNSSSPPTDWRNEYWICPCLQSEVMNWADWMIECLFQMTFSTQSDVFCQKSCVRITNPILSYFLRSLVRLTKFNVPKNSTQVVVW